MLCANCGARVPDPFVGTVIDDRYKIESKIADGGFGSIYRGTQLNIGRPVAVKVMHEELGADENLVARFRREGVVLCNLRDAHSVTTYELGNTPDGRLFIVMELLEGRTLLDDARAGGPLPWTRMFQIAKLICSALAEAHALGIVHRDLKPANIFLENRKNQRDFVKVLDFGIAKIMHDSGLVDGSELTVMGQAVGTLEYMAPEQLMGGKCDGRTDIYTLGVLAYEMICGRRPFYDVVGLDLLTEQLTRSPPLPSELADVPGVVDRVLLRCLEHDADARYPDVNALATAIGEALDYAGIATPSWEIPLEPPQRPSEPKLPQRVSDHTTMPRVDALAGDTLRKPDLAGDTVRQIEPPSHVIRARLETGATARADSVPMPDIDLRPSRVGLMIAIVVVLAALGAGAVLAFYY